MKKPVVALLMLAAFGLATPAASADPILYEAAFSQNGTLYTGGSKPSNWTLSLDAYGLGTITANVTLPGLHNLLVFLDYEIDESVNTYFNEFGSVNGAPGAGLTWEIDEPGFVFGDIYANFVAGALDGTNGVPVGSPDDVSFAMHRSFVLGDGETAIVKFVTQTTRPAGGFYLVHTDPDSASSVYLSSDLDINGGGGPVIPEPGTMTLLGLGLAVAARRLRRRG